MEKLLKKCRRMSPFPSSRHDQKRSYDFPKIKKIRSFWPNAVDFIPLEKVILTKSLP